MGTTAGYPARNRRLQQHPPAFSFDHSRLPLLETEPSQIRHTDNSPPHARKSSAHERDGGRYYPCHGSKLAPCTCSTTVRGTHDRATTLHRKVSITAMQPNPPQSNQLRTKQHAHEGTKSATAIHLIPSPPGPLDKRPRQHRATS